MIKTLKISGVTKSDLTTSNNRERYAWIKNNTGGNVYASVLDSTCTAGADNVAEIAAGDVRMVDTLSLGYLWISGNGSVEIQLSDSENCPFKISQKGGDISAEGDSVQLGGLQGSVPFSEVIVRGDNIVGQELTVTACGKNLLKSILSTGEETKNGVTYTINQDKSITINGTSTAGTKFMIGTATLTENKQYRMSMTAANVGVTMHIGVGQDTTSQYDYTATSKTITAQSNANTIWLWVPADVTLNNVTIYPQLEVGDTTTAYDPYSGADYTITPDSNPYTVTTEIYQQNGINTIYVTGEGEPTLSVKGVKTNAAVKRIWDKLNELTTAVIVSNGEI